MTTHSQIGTIKNRRSINIEETFKEPHCGTQRKVDDNRRKEYDSYMFSSLKTPRFQFIIRGDTLIEDISLANEHNFFFGHQKSKHDKRRIKRKTLPF